MQDKSRPKMPLSVECAEIYRQNDKAVYYFVTFVDTDGKRWQSEDAHFCYDLRPIVEDKEGTSDA